MPWRPEPMPRPTYAMPPPPRVVPEYPPYAAPPPPRAGAQVEANVGTGFSDRYNVGVGARLGFTTDLGLYLGGDIEHFIARDSAGPSHVTFIGAELGMKFFPTLDQRLEIRPYGFAGGAIDPSGNSQLAIHPGVVAAYRFGGAFVSLDGRLLALPGPASVAMMFGAGVVF